MRKARATRATPEDRQEHAPSPIDRLLFFDHDFNPIKNLLGDELPAALAPAMSLWEHFPELDKLATMQALRSMGEGVQSLRLSINIRKPGSQRLTIFQIGNMYAVVRSGDRLDAK